MRTGGALTTRRRAPWLAGVAVLVASVGPTAAAAPVGPAPVGPAPAAPTAMPALTPPAAPAAMPRELRDTSLHRYSDPVWYPLRKSAWVSCARSNCVREGEHYHDYWAQDWSGSIGRDSSGNWLEIHPIHAAGAGQVRIDRNDRRCGSSVIDGERTGTIVSVDHGGGVFSVYKHLDIEVTDGQWVTPNTRLGTMAAWGSNQCNLPYLHFEIHAGGRTGPFQPFNEMKACRAGATRIWPDDMPPYDPNPDDGRDPARYETWDDVTPYSTVPKKWRGPLAVPPGDSSCVTTTFATPDAPAAPGVSSTTDSIAVTLPVAPEDARETIISVQLFRPSSNAWAEPSIRSVAPSATTHTISGLDVGRTYRVRVAHRNHIGASEWSAPSDVQLGGAPLAPEVPRSLKSGRTWISFGWNRSVRVGFPITGYEVAVRAKVRGVWQPWETTLLGNGTYMRWENRRVGTPHQLRVRARSQGGASAWSRVVSVTTLR